MPLAAGDQHDILGMIVAQHGDRRRAVAGDRREHGPPGGAIGVGVDLEAERGAIPVGEQLQLVEPLVEPVRPQARHRRLRVEMDEQIDRELVELGLALRRRVERLAQPVVAEIVEQQQAAVEIAGEDGGRGKPGRGEPFARPRRRGADPRAAAARPSARRGRAPATTRK